MIIRIPKVAILVSHPTQFEAPLYKFITESGLVDLRVYFWTTANTSRLIDPELGHPPGWDFPLTEGYKWDLLPQKPRNLWKFLKQNIFQHGRFDAILRVCSKMVL